MQQSFEAIYDGTVLRPEKSLELQPNTRVRVTVEVLPAARPAASSFLRTAQSLEIQGPADWSENLDHYLYDDADPAR